MNALIYEAIGSKPDEQLAADIERCNGWDDYAGMGIACISAYDYVERRCRVFMEDNLGAFAGLIEKRDVLVSFNGLAFDNRVCAANGIDVPQAKSYDLLVEFWRAADLGPVFEYPTHAGFSLDKICHANFGRRKSGNGAQFQRRQYGALQFYGALIDYCLHDVALIKRLFDHVAFSRLPVLDPRDWSRRLRLRDPRDRSGPMHGAPRRPR